MLTVQVNCTKFKFYTTGFPAMPNQIRPRAPTAQVRPTAMSSRAITGQSVTGGRGIPVNTLRPQGGPMGARPTSYPSQRPGMPAQQARAMPQVSIIYPLG